MAEKRVVYALYLLNEPRFSKRYWSMAEQLIASISSYFDAGNTVPVIVGTDSVEIRNIVSYVSDILQYPVEVVIARPSEMKELSARYAEPICRNRIDECRLDVVTSKIYAMLHLGVEYDRLMVDIDTTWFRKVPWDRFEHMDMVMFTPSQWKHPLSITVGQILYYRAKYMAKKPLPDYIDDLIRADPIWKRLPSYATVPWPNSGVFYIKSACTREQYVKELDNPALTILSVEDETPLVSLLLKGGVREVGLQMNVPVAFTDISMEDDLLHPGEIICAHYHRLPKPDMFDITYAGIVRHPALHEPYSLEYLHDSIASGQYGSMSGILWCYVWRYYYSIAAKLYRNGNDTPVYGPEFWKDIIERYYVNRRMWLDSIEGQRELQGIKL